MLAISAALSIFVFGLQGSSALQLPKKALIEGVPFIGFEEVGAWNYPNRDILNRTYAASTAMVLEYWGKSARMDYAKEAKAAFGEANKVGWAKTDSKRTVTFEELKGYLAKGIPVVVPTPNSVYGHHISPPVARVIESNDKKDVQTILKPRGVPAVTGILGGRVLSLEDFQKLRNAKIFGEFNPIRESVLDHVRVVIGYDDERQVVTVHDPTYGPGMEIHYEGFLKLWKSMDNFSGAFWPEDFESFLASKPKDSPFRARNSDEIAAEYYFDGYALASTGRLSEATVAYQKGMNVKGLSDGFRHLFLLEIASVKFGMDKPEAGLPEAIEAARLVPENAFSWDLLHAIFKKSKMPDAPQKAKEARQKLEAIWKDRDAKKKLSKVLPSNFNIPVVVVTVRLRESIGPSP